MKHSDWSLKSSICVYSAAVGNIYSGNVVFHEPGSQSALK